MERLEIEVAVGEDKILHFVNENIIEFRDVLNKRIEAGATHMDLDIRSSGFGNLDSIEVNFFKFRVESDEHFEKRKLEAKQSVEAMKKFDAGVERKEYERLKEKFENN